MGCWDEFCVICGGPPNAPGLQDVVDEAAESIDEAEAKLEGGGDMDFQVFEWLNSFVGINEAEKLVPLGKYGSYGSFDLADGTGYFDGTAGVRYLRDDEVEPNLYGLLCHEKCFRVLQRDLSYTLRFLDVWPLLMQQDYGGHLEEFTDYGGMQPYQDQFFLFRELFVDGKQWMLQDPMTHRDNAERILKVWRPFVESGFKVQKKIKQPEPHQPASLEAATDIQTASQAMDEGVEEDYENKKIV